MSLFQNYILIIAWLCLWPVAIQAGDYIYVKHRGALTKDEATFNALMNMATYIIVLVCIVKAGPA